MMTEQRLKRPVTISAARPSSTEPKLHPAWRAFIEYCAEVKHGEIETLKVQDGLPVLAEVVRKKIKFAR